MTFYAVQSGTVIASGHLVRRSTYVRMYTELREGGEGPTRYKCTCEHQVSGAETEPIGLRLCRCSLERWRWMQAQAQVRTSLFTLGQTKLYVTNFKNARIPDCANEWSTSKTARLKETGTNCLRHPVEVWHRIVPYVIVTV